MYVFLRIVLPCSELTQSKTTLRRGLGGTRRVPQPIFSPPRRRLTGGTAAPAGAASAHRLIAHD